MIEVIFIANLALGRRDKRLIFLDDDVWNQYFMKVNTQVSTH